MSIGSQTTAKLAIAQTRDTLDFFCSTSVVSRLNPRHSRHFSLPHLLPHFDQHLTALLVEPIGGVNVTHADVLFDGGRWESGSDDSDLSHSVRSEDSGSLCTKGKVSDSGDQKVGRRDVPRAGAPFSTTRPTLLRVVPPFLSSAKVLSEPMNDPGERRSLPAKPVARQSRCRPRPLETSTHQQPSPIQLLQHQFPHPNHVHKDKVPPPTSNYPSLPIQPTSLQVDPTTFEQVVQ